MYDSLPHNLVSPLLAAAGQDLSLITTIAAAFTAAWVLGLELVLPDGSVIETGSVGSRAKQSSAGLELTKLIVGAEGTLGVVTRLRLKLMAIPPARAIVLGLFDVL